MDYNGHILLIDDNVDASTVRRALNDMKVSNPLARASDGKQGLRFLRDPVNAHSGLILLDLNMPRKNGFEFLTEIKNDDGLKSIPVVVLTTSSQDEDRTRSFKSYISSYMLKPVEYPQFVEVLRLKHAYWRCSECDHK